ncbi:MAG: hypothetical protein PHC28_06720 [Flavobacterium sp.]|uniref:hypothetical protein n=1 Tax=Flavobacterium sp. TaxID=239 RepID=UPI002618AA2F|nr:hypothetical protein [Flavobacterium sp.]MDD5150163.1 hypothetical protein [Flavobacterium sp.]
MNIKITEEQHKIFCDKFEYDTYLFGSYLFCTNNENSDRDYINVIKGNFDEEFITLGKYLPNFNTWQYDDVYNNNQIVWMTERQFYQNLFSGDGHIIADIILLSGRFQNGLFLCRTYKIIKGYLGLVKRDLKFFDKNNKKRLHCLRGLYIAECLIENRLPLVSEIQSLTFIDRLSIVDKLDVLRNRLNLLYDKNEINLYPDFKESADVIDLLVKSNNMKEFTYN